MNIVSHDQPDPSQQPAGHYSRSVSAGGFIFVSGQLPRTADGTHDPAAPFEAQVRRALANIATILAEAGANWQDVSKVTAYIVGSEHWSEFNRIYAEVLGSAKPARTVVPVPELHYGYLVEIDAVAFVARTA